MAVNLRGEIDRFCLENKLTQVDGEPLADTKVGDERVRYVTLCADGVKREGAEVGSWFTSEELALASYKVGLQNVIWAYKDRIVWRTRPELKTISVYSNPSGQNLFQIYSRLIATSGEGLSDGTQEIAHGP